MLGKHARDAEEVSIVAASSGNKRLLQAEFLHLLDNDDEVQASEEDVSGVMRSLEQEIVAATSCSTSSLYAGEGVNGGPSETLGQSTGAAERNDDLGFLLEASDDELGIGKDDEISAVAAVASNGGAVTANDDEGGVLLPQDEEAFGFTDSQTMLSIAENWNLEEEFWGYNEHFAGLAGGGIYEAAAALELGQGFVAYDADFPSSAAAWRMEMAGGM